jgi:CBS domain-containing protein
MDIAVSALLERKGSVIHSVAPSVTIAAAVAEMNRHRVGCIVVVEHGRLAGIFTERDVLRRVVGAALDPNATRVADVMTRNVFTITPETTVETTMVLFADRRCRHLPVVEDGAIVGLVSIGDISRWMAEMHRNEAEQLKNYITGGFVN